VKRATGTAGSGGSVHGGGARQRRPVVAARPLQLRLHMLYMLKLLLLL
jgi:hypothetical protein